MKGDTMNFNSILIGSEDPERLKDYYTKLFGKPTWDDGAYFGWAIGTGAVTVGPHDQVHGKSKEPGRIIWNIETADVRGQFQKLKAAGATVAKEPYDPAENTELSGMLIATFADPDGNFFQLMSPMDAETVEKMQRSTTATR
jgi:predicted enzyme related to lactoylglutathione lyase